MAFSDSSLNITQMLKKFGLLFFHFLLVAANGRLFTLESLNGTQSFDLEAARRSCDLERSRLATAEELRLAVLECSFNDCTKGWLANGVVGTIVCNQMDNEPQSGMKAISVKIDNVMTMTEEYDAFCVKDEDKPCGDPPSFPNTILHGHTGFEMGDELLYICSHGYVMGRGESAFTLLCDSCGKWYGQVHACVKDETEAFIDYEDNFHDDKDIPDMDSHNEEDDYGEDHMEHHEFSLNVHSEQRSQLEDLPSIAKANKVPTKSPFSILSEKHLFWLPPEVISHPQSQMEPYEVTKVQHLNNINHNGMFPDYIKPLEKQNIGSKDFLIHHPRLNNNTRTNKNSTDTKDGSAWSGKMENRAVEDGQSSDGSLEMEDASLNILQTHNLEYNVHVSTFPPSTVMSRIVSSLTSVTKFGVGKGEVQLKPTVVPEYINSDERNHYVIGYETGDVSTISKTPTDEVTDSTPLAFHTVNPHSMHLSTIYDASVHTTSAEVVTMWHDPKRIVEELLEGTNIFATVDPCLDDNCPLITKSQLIIIMVIVCLLLLATVAAVWCYKKQQDSAMYNFKGKKQTNHTQQIEMQKI
ncbi:sushi domain-containing protein 5 [Spea bombifrons]|uniref:sushi domain-containing protein 5 n=1 Tax=Spea bombifrons TaxID=233779 RepID=UPI00234A502B|nr:sushi domain-containing protein 5 [Spea bombifrons]